MSRVSVRFCSQSDTVFVKTIIDPRERIGLRRSRGFPGGLQQGEKKLFEDISFSNCLKCVESWENVRIAELHKLIPNASPIETILTWHEVLI